MTPPQNIFIYSYSIYQSINRSNYLLTYHVSFYLPVSIPVTFLHLNNEACFLFFIFQSKSNVLQDFTVFLAGQKVLSDHSEVFYIINILCYGPGEEISKNLGLQP